MKMLHGLGLLLAATRAATQRVAIRPGMAEAQVRAILGQPEVVRRVGSRSYLFYANGCPIRCGTDDVVFLDNGHVTRVFLRTAASYPGGVRTGAGAQPRKIVVGPRNDAVLRPADGFAAPRPAVADTTRALRR